MNLAALKAEISTAPYAGKSDEECADLLNAPGPSVDRDSVSGGEIAASVVIAEYAALSPTQRDYVNGLMGADSIPLTANFKTQLAGLFPGGSGTRTNLVAR